MGRRQLAERVRGQDPGRDERPADRGPRRRRWREGADELLKYAISKAPTQGMLYANFGGHLYRTKRYDEAEKYLEQGVKVGGVTSAAYSFLGHTYTKLGKFKEAVETWKECVKRFPNYPAGPPNLKAAEARLAAANPK